MREKSKNKILIFVITFFLIRIFVRALALGNATAISKRNLAFQAF